MAKIIKMNQEWIKIIQLKYYTYLLNKDLDKADYFSFSLF